MNEIIIYQKSNELDITFGVLTSQMLGPQRS